MSTPTAPFTVPDGLRCAACSKSPTTTQVAESDYRCPACGADLGHLDLAPNGLVRGILGWLRQPGDVLADRYRVRGLLGKGGFAATYVVEDLRLAGKRRAVKEIPDLFFDERETEILARIHHPAVPDITDRFAADGMIYLVLEFGGDRTLESVRVAEGGRITLERLLPWVDQLCDVLAYLHSQSPPIVHRDLKPANVLLDESNRVRLIDFGIAKEAMPSAATRTIARSASHGFSPPEQVLGTGTDERSDVYALGATFYALLTGQLPAPAHERVAGAEIAPLREFIPDVPAAVEDTVLRALELSVARRPPSIRAFRESFGAAPIEARRPASMAPRTTVIPQRPNPEYSATGPAVLAPTMVGGIAPARLLAVGGVVALLLAAAGWWALRGGDETADAPITNGAPIRTAPVAPEPPVVTEPVVPPTPAGREAGAAVANPVDPTPTPNPVAPDATAPGPQQTALDALLSKRSEPVEAIIERTNPPRPPPRRATPKPPPKPAGTGWEELQGPTRGYERKVQ